MTAQEIVFVGAGNLATHLAAALAQAGHKVKAICSRTAASAEALARRVGEGATALTNLNHLPPADVFLLATSDDALPDLIAALPAHCRNGIVAHTAGSVSLEVLARFGEKASVFYPLQTFSKAREVDFTTIPCFVEGASAATEQRLLELAQSVTPTVQVLHSEGRRMLHLSAVFACNFVNHLYDVAAGIAREQGIDPQWLSPLIQETAAKLNQLPAHAAQTGPAARGDRAVLEHQAELLAAKPELQTIYRILSDNIYKSFHP